MNYIDVCRSIYIKLCTKSRLHCYLQVTLVMIIFDTTKLHNYYDKWFIALEHKALSMY